MIVVGSAVASCFVGTTCQVQKDDEIPSQRNIIISSQLTSTQLLQLQHTQTTPKQTQQTPPK